MSPWRSPRSRSSRRSRRWSREFETSAARDHLAAAQLPEQILEAPAPRVVAPRALVPRASDRLPLRIVREVVAAQVRKLALRSVADDLLPDLVVERDLVEPSGDVERSRHRRLELAEPDLAEGPGRAVRVAEDEEAQADLALAEERDVLLVAHGAVELGCMARAEPVPGHPIAHRLEHVPAAERELHRAGENSG